MSPAVLEAYIRDTIAAQASVDVQFIWQGGEPTLLGMAFFAKVIALQQRYGQGKRIHNAMQTHGGLLNAAWAQFLAQHNFLVGLSIDGPQALHDHYRVDKQGRATFNDTLRGLRLLQQYGVRFNTLTVINRHNAEHPLAVYRFLKDIGAEVMQFIPLVERISPHAGFSAPLSAAASDASVSAESVLPAQFGEFMLQIFDEWVRADVGRHFVQHFDAALSIWMGQGSPLCVFAPECGRVPALEANGDLYACDHYVYPEWKIGNILNTPLAQLIDSPPQQAFGQAKASLPMQCQRCEVRFACQGECPKNRFTFSKDGEWGLNYLCAGYQRFFSHIDLPMRAMRQLLQEGRPAADIMQLLAPDKAVS